jgi:GDP-4-dehydro-6-deoxy-D-mannose reductase
MSGKLVRGTPKIIDGMIRDFNKFQQMDSVKTMKCFITGASGFIGSHLTEFLLKRGLTVYGLDKQIGGFLDNLQGDFHFISSDILDRARIFDAISSVQPDYIFHLAAQSLPKVSWEDPETTIKINVFGTLYLLDAIRAANINPVVEIFCSSGEYAISKDGNPINEDQSLEPYSPYALSKIAQDQLSVLYWKNYQLRIIRVRPFFVIGPRKVGDVCSDFARGVVSIERGLEKKLKVGNLDIVRDFLDVQDAVNALYLIADQGTPGEVYNICSGSGHSIGEIAKGLQRLSKTHFEIETDASLRRLDEPVKIGDNNKLRALGWNPSIDFQSSLALILESWRNKTLSPPTQ